MVSLKLSLRKKVSVASIMIVAALFLSCAHQGTPGGGPEDKAGPTLMETSPVSGSLNVSREKTISIFFSEWISKSTALKSVSVLPTVEGGLNITVNGRRLDITPKIGFKPGTTYHVLVTATMSDLHGNALAKAEGLVFSTGPVLDSGKVSGCVVDRRQKVLQPVVALYNFDSDSSDTALWGTPQYLTQTDSGGSFVFNNIHTGTYRLLAFADQNNSRTLQPGVEDAYAGVYRTIAIADQPVVAHLYPIKSDTAMPKVQSVSAVSRALVVCQWTMPFDTVRKISPVRFFIERIEKGAVRPVNIASVVWTNSTIRSYLLLEDTLAIGSYTVRYRYEGLQGGRRTSFADTIRFNGTQQKDTVTPVLFDHKPSGSVDLTPEIVLIWSEPVQCVSPLQLVDSLGDTLHLACSPFFTDTTICTPDRKLSPGRKYRLVLFRSSAKDMAGNSLKARDSTDTVKVITLSAVDRDSMAILLQGCGTCLEPEPARLWQFTPLLRGRQHRTADSSGCFRFDSIPYGKGTLAYWSDNNRNNKPDIGRLVPWIPSEPYVALSDTIEARARWEIEGVSISACEKCGAKAVKEAIKK